MAVVLRSATKLYVYLNDISDPRTVDFPLVETPWPVAIITIYLLLVMRWIPNHMKNRQPYEIRPLIIAYNLCQILGCAFVFYQSLALCWLSHYSLVCQPVDEGPYGDQIVSQVVYGYYILKLIDLIDTVFFALRKKQNHVSFLHVYHHSGMVIVAWCMIKWVPGGHFLSLVTLNSFVHVVMYTYYLLTILDESFKNSAWWKKHVTQLQICQFSCLLVHFISSLVPKDCRYPRTPAYFMIPQNLFVTSMFLDFYYKTYIAKKPVVKPHTN